MTDVFIPAAAEAVSWPQDRGCPYHPSPGYDSMAQSRPLGRIKLYDGRGAWLVTGHALARQLLIDPRLASDQQHPNFPFPSPRFRGSQEFRTPLLGVDGADHKAHRRGLIPAFSYRRIATLRPHIQSTVDSLIDELVAGGPTGDVVTGLALPVSAMTTCGLLGVPYEDNEFFKDRVYGVLRSTTNEKAEAASIELQQYLADLFVRKETEPGEDLLSDLLAEQARNHTIERHELIGIVVLLLLAGYDTTASSISLGVYTLLEHPERLAELRADWSLMPAAVEELLRFQSVADGVLRIAVADIEVAGQTIRAGEGVVISNAMANRDGSAYADPDTLDWHRSARHHLGFGHGIHQCIGQNVARAEIEISLRTLFTRLPGLRLAVPAGEVRMPPGDTVQGPVELSVTW
jgi:pentalenic acid synthase